MKKFIKTIKILLLLMTLATLILFVSCELYQYKMKSNLFTIDRIVLQKDGEKDILPTEIKIDSEVKSILRKAKYVGGIMLFKGEKEYSGTCYFQDGTTGNISISQIAGQTSIYVSDDYLRCFAFKNEYGKVWINFIESKIADKN